MVIDTSALVAILFDEPGRRALTRAIEADPVRLLSAANLVECALVVEARRGEPAGRELDLLLHRGKVDTVPVTADHVEIARQAWRRYGKGRHRPGSISAPASPMPSPDRPVRRCCMSETTSPAPTSPGSTLTHNTIALSRQARARWRSW